MMAVERSALNQKERADENDTGVNHTNERKVS
jgi:hypothetical protein